MTVISKENRYLSLKLATLFISSVVLSQQAFAYEPSHSGGISIGTMGLGISASNTTQLHLIRGDSIQWRAAVSGFDADDEFSVSIAGTDYDATDYSRYSIQGGIDWYPIQSSGWGNDVFLSGGLIYQNYSANYSANNKKAYTVGSTTVNPGDLDSFTADVKRSEIVPYVSLGWGNKIEKTPGFDFSAEVGVIFSSDDPKVKLKAQGSNNNVTASDLTKEKQNIQDDLGGASAFANITVAYHF
ncbi:hypothetical protein M3I01_011935 [Marinomonas sp. RSW2]|uniref:Outer membrane protein beta-barrel domain-containing protein n=1 Tax=Marinomonas maritima TaxID=2940935 RepID=A0ABT5WG02_9GAMM|nr:hypothetical protein [Marinomonas maritima]MDE8603602.1 hypothetical protein [Marinomonas maritima]